MRLHDVTTISRILRTSRRGDVHAAAGTVARALNELPGVGMGLICARPERVYSSRRVGARARRSILEKIGMAGARWIEPPEGPDPGIDEAGPDEHLELELSFDHPLEWRLLLYGGDIPAGDPALEMLTETISLYLAGASGASSDGDDADGDAVAALRDAALGGEGFREALEKVMDDTGSEICAYYREEDEGRLYLMLEGRSLSTVVPGIMDKVRTSYRMFTNSMPGEKICREKVYYRNPARWRPVGDEPVTVESFFLVPVASAGSSVDGVLFVGSVRRDAFVREAIFRYRDLASGGAAGGGMAPGPAGEIALKEMLSSLPYGAALVTAEGTVVSSNPFFASTVGVAGRPASSLAEIADRSPFDLHGLWDEYSRTGSNMIDRRITSSNESDRCLSVSLLRTEKSAGEANTLLVARDISEIAIEERERDESMAVVAHEIRTPMTALRNSLKIMLEDEAGRGGAEGPVASGSRGAPFLETALRTVDRLSLLVDGLVESSAARAGRPSVDPETVDTGRFLERASTLFRSSISKKEIDFSIEVEKGAETICVDAEKIEQVIQNLLSNSLRHVPSGGRIALEVETAGGDSPWIDGLVPGPVRESMRFVRIAVIDSGPGIPQEVAGRINRPFDEDERAVRPSGGLGLYIASRLVRGHGGRMVVPATAEGSRVEIRLPADRETGETMRTVIEVISVIRSMESRGARVILYVIAKDRGICWLDVAGMMKSRPVLSPSSEEILREGVYLWPLGPEAAFALTAAGRWVEDPVSIFRGGSGGLRMMESYGEGMFEAGWAVSPADGRSYTALAEKAFAMLERQLRAPVKGVQR